MPIVYMVEKLSLEQGKLLVKKAREAVESSLDGKKAKPLSGGAFDCAHSLFVTLNTHPKGELAGCVGFVNSNLPLGQAVVQASLHAAFNDSRFTPVCSSGLGKIVFEVSVLGIPKELTCPATQRRNHIQIGRDGLLLEYGEISAVLLAQVATEWNFQATNFLEALCQKAGLPKDMHSSKAVRILTFNQQIFAEQTPKGKIVQKKLFS